MAKYAPYTEGRFDPPLDENSLLADNLAWNGQSGLSVEDFITRTFDKLDGNTIESSEFIKDGNKLFLYKKNGEIIETELELVDPRYEVLIKLFGIKDKNGNEFKFDTAADPIVALGDGLQVGMLLNTKIITSSVKDALISLSVLFSMGTALPITLSVMGVSEEVFNLDNPADYVVWVDISNLVKNVRSASVLTASVTFRSQSSDIQTVSASSNVKIAPLYPTIECNYTEFVFSGTEIQFLVNGTCGLDYVLDGLVRVNGTMTKLQGGLTQTLQAGRNEFFVRAKHSTISSIYSDFITVNTVCTNGGTYQETEVVINNLRDTVENHAISTLFTVDVYSPGKEEIQIKSYIADDSFLPSDDLNTLLTEVIQSLVIDASQYDNNIVHTEALKYIEFLQDSAEQYIYININGDWYNFPRYTAGNIYNSIYHRITIEPPIAELSYVKDYPHTNNFDLIVAYDSALFTKDKINELPIEMGLLNINGLCAFVVENLEVFKTPLNAGCSNNFTIEVALKTSNIGNYDESIITFSGSSFCFKPNLFCDFADNLSLRNSYFRPDTLTHITITAQTGFNHNSLIRKPLYLGDVAVDKVQNFSYRYNNPLKVYVNGVIDREIILTNEEFNKFRTGEIQIYPHDCGLELYLFRIYQNTTLTSQLVLLNYISFLSKKEDKWSFYNANNILSDSGEISYDKTKKLYNSLLYIYPKNAKFPHRGWGGTDNEDPPQEGTLKNIPVTLYINYADPEINRLYGGRLTNGQVKGQGSSAMRYLIWNVSYTLNKVKGENGDTLDSIFTNYNALASDNTFDSTKTTEYTPNSTDFHLMTNAYVMPTYSGEIDVEPYKIKKLVGKVNFASSMQSHKIGACKLYDDAHKSIFGGSGLGKLAVHEEPFMYFYWETDFDDETVRNMDLVTIAENDNNIKFMGFQTWGAGKGDKAEYGYTDDNKDTYLLLEGAENGNDSTNFLVPWNALQYQQTGSEFKNVTYLSKEESKASSVTSLNINDNTIMYGKGAWDIEFGSNDDGNAFEDSIIPSVEQFRLFYDCVYKYDFDIVLDTTQSTSTSTGKTLWDGYKGKKVCTVNSFNPRPGVLSGARGNIYRYDVVEEEWVNAGLYRSASTGDGWEVLNITELGVNEVESDYSILDVIKENFKTEIANYIDIEDVAFHEAFIKLIAGTDNKAKNTYFYLGKNKDSANLVDYTIRLLQDDMDTIFATDNNGMQSIPYNILEKAYTDVFTKRWNDSTYGNRFFTAFDRLFENEIKELLSNIIDVAFNHGATVDSKENYFHKVFFDVLENFPAVAYNHAAQLYYETAWLVLNSGALGDIYQNNSRDPILQSHGSCVETEKQFMEKRLNMLTGYAQTKLTHTMATRGSNSGMDQPVLLQIINGTSALDFYPLYYTTSTGLNYIRTSETSNYDIINHQVAEGATDWTFNGSFAEGVDEGLTQTDLYKTLTIGGLIYGEITASFKNLEYLKITDSPGLQITVFRPNMPVLKTLDVTGIQMPVTAIDLSNYKRLLTAYLTGTGTNSVVLPVSSLLQHVDMPESLLELRIYNNPNLNTLNTGSLPNLQVIEIDCSKIGSGVNISELLNGTNLSEVKLTNANISITDQVLSRLLSLGNKFTFTGTIDLTEDVNTTCSYTTLRMLVLKWPNLVLSVSGSTATLLNGQVTIKYVIYSNNVASAVDVEVIGSSYPVSQEIYPIYSGNDIRISNGIDCSITSTIPSSGNNWSIDNKILTVTSEPSGEVTISVNIRFYTTDNKVHTLTVNYILTYIEPKLGDYLYKDGRYSKTVLNSNDIIGFIYKKDPATKTAYVISSRSGNTFIPEYPLGLYPHIKSLETGSTGLEGYPYSLYIIEDWVLRTLNISDTNYFVPTFTSSSRNVGLDLWEDPEQNLPAISSFNGLSDTEAYVAIANKFLREYRTRIAGLSAYVESNGTISKSGPNGLDNLIEVCRILNNLLSNYNINGVGCAVIFPYFYARYLYKSHENDTLQWYAPSLGEWTTIIYDRVWSTKQTGVTPTLSGSAVLENLFLGTRNEYREPYVFPSNPEYLGDWNTMFKDSLVALNATTVRDATGITNISYLNHDYEWADMSLKRFGYIGLNYNTEYNNYYHTDSGYYWGNSANILSPLSPHTGFAFTHFTYK